MNLADCSYLEWLAVQEVCLLIRDIADYMVLDDVTQMDAVLYESSKYKILKIQNSIALQLNSEDVNYYNSFIVAANTDPMDDNRPYSTRYQSDKKRMCIREGSGEILVVNDRNWFWRDIQGDEVYLPTLIHVNNEEELRGELFQKGLVYSTDEINAMVLNFMLKDTLCEENHTKVYICFANSVQKIYDAHSELQEMKKKCLPNSI
jgi:hypothetical protein